MIAKLSTQHQFTAETELGDDSEIEILLAIVITTSVGEGQLELWVQAAEALLPEAVTPATATNFAEMVSKCLTMQLQCMPEHTLTSPRSRYKTSSESAEFSS